MLRCCYCWFCFKSLHGPLSGTTELLVLLGLLPDRRRLCTARGAQVGAVEGAISSFKLQNPVCGVCEKCRRVFCQALLLPFFPQTEDGPGSRAISISAAEQSWVGCVCSRCSTKKGLISGLCLPLMLTTPRPELGDP